MSKWAIEGMANMDGQDRQDVVFVVLVRERLQGTVLLAAPDRIYGLLFLMFLSCSSCSSM
jgi:hypothetical protein